MKGLSKNGSCAGHDMSHTASSVCGSYNSNNNSSQRGRMFHQSRKPTMRQPMFQWKVQDKYNELKKLRNCTAVQSMSLTDAQYLGKDVQNMAVATTLKVYAESPVEKQQ